MNSKVLELRKRTLGFCILQIDTTAPGVVVFVVAGIPDTIFPGLGLRSTPLAVPADEIAAKVGVFHIPDIAFLRVDTMNGHLLIVPVLITVPDRNGDFAQFFLDGG